MNKNIKYAFATGLATMVVAAAPIAFADEHGAQGDAEGHANAGLHLGLFGLGKFFDLNGKGNVNAQLHAKADQDNDDDATSTKNNDENASSTRAQIRAALASKFEQFLAAGTVTGTTSTGFTINELGPVQKSTTTVTTNGSTVFIGKGGATTTAPTLATGTRVVVIGTTTAITPTGDSITAQIVKILGDGWNHVKHFLGL